MNQTSSTACDAKCPQDTRQICGGAGGAYSVYVLSDNDVDTPCISCPTTLSAIKVETSADCAGGFFPPVANPGFWAQETVPLQFFKCTKGKGCLGGTRYQFATPTSSFGESRRISLCAQGYRKDSLLCAACDEGYTWGSALMGGGGRCVACPHKTSYAFTPLYLLFPAAMFLGWYPGLYTLLGKAPSAFVFIAYLQISAAIGGFAIRWHPFAASVLGLFSIFNFDRNLFFFECSMAPLGKSLLFQWLFLNMLPLLYAAKYFGAYYYSHRWGDGSTKWNEACKSAMFLVNLLYLPVTSSVLELFRCENLGDGTMYLKLQPASRCWEGEHLAAVMLCPVSVLVVTFGWPMLMGSLFHAGRVHSLLQNKHFAGTVGFLYQRYEVYYFWYAV